MEGWFSGLPSAILKALGINSPPQWALDAGKHIMNGLLSSFAHGASDVKAFFVGLASDITGPLKAAWRRSPAHSPAGEPPAGSGSRGRVDHGRAWPTAGAPASWLPLLETLVQKESGGNPGTSGTRSRWTASMPAACSRRCRAHSRSSQQWRAAYSTRSPMRWPGSAYIMAEYGSPANIPGLTGGTYVGYAAGGEIPEQVIGYGMSSGKVYQFGERGREYVVPSSGAGGGTSLNDVVNRLDALIRVAGQIPAGVGSHVGGALGGAASAAAFRSRYPRVEVRCQAAEVLPWTASTVDCDTPKSTAMRLEFTCHAASGFQRRSPA